MNFIERRFLYDRFYSQFGYSAANRPELLFVICYEIRHMEVGLTATELCECNEFCELADVLLETEEGQCLT